MTRLLSLFRRWLLVSTTIGALLLIPIVARAHPLGNFTINHHLGIHITENGLQLEYIIDMAEIPAFSIIRELDTTDKDGLHKYAATACTEFVDGLWVSLDGEDLRIDVTGWLATTPPGNSGVPTLRIECDYETEVTSGRLEVANTNYEDRIGWREMVATSEGAVIATDLPAESSSKRLTEYPDDRLSSPPDVRAAVVIIGEGEAAPRTPLPLAGSASLGSRIRIEELGPGTGVIALGAALVLGAGHALAPGHGKTVVAAYLVGSRGNARQAVILALATAISHTVGVGVLGLAAATASVTFEPAIVYPYLSTIAGLVVVAIGARLLWRLLRSRRHGHGSSDHHHHGHPHPPAMLGWKSVATLGLTGGLMPSASAVVLLLGAVHIGQVWFGILLVGAFGAGMSIALVGSGLFAVLAQRLGWRYLTRHRSGGQLQVWATRLAAAAVIVLGVVMTIGGLGDFPLTG